MVKTPESHPERLYFSIGEVADMFGVNASLIRFWEKEFDIIKPHRSKKGNRLFTQGDVANFRLIYHLVRERGYTLQGARDKLKQQPEELARDMEIIHRLDKVRHFLLEVKKQLS